MGNSHTDHGTLDLRVAQLVKELDECKIIPDFTRVGLQDDLQTCIDINGDPDPDRQGQKRQLLASIRNCIHFYRFIESMNERHVANCSMNPHNWEEDEHGKPIAPWAGEIKEAIAIYSASNPTKTVENDQSSTVNFYGVSGKRIISFGGRAATLVALPTLCILIVVGTAYYLRKGNIEEIRKVLAEERASIPASTVRN